MANVKQMKAVARPRAGKGAARAERRAGRVPGVIYGDGKPPLTVSVESPMTAADHVTAVHVMSERNPDPEVATFRFTPRSGRATVSTRIRLADSQKIVAIAKLSDGSFWSASIDVVVTLAACTEDVI